MLWITYAGFCLIGIGCFALMVGIIEYDDRMKDLQENLLNRDICGHMSTTTDDSCARGVAIGFAYATEKVNESYRSITLSSIVVASGIALTLSSYVRPSWFKRITRETTNHDRTTSSEQP